MNGHLLGTAATAAWVLEDFWISLLLAAGLLALRAFRRGGLGEGQQLLSMPARRWAIRWSDSATMIPVLVWGFEANHFARLVEGTHASVDPTMLLASMQVFLGALCSLGLIVGLDLLGRFLEWRRLDRAHVALPAGVVLVVGIVVADWLLSQIGWWALLDHQTGP